MSDKFCEHCIFLSDESNVGHYTSITYRNNRKFKLQHNMHICLVNMEEHEYEQLEPIQKIRRRNIIVDDPIVLNEKNNCEFYEENVFCRIMALILKRQFFWVKRQEMKSNRSCINCAFGRNGDCVDGKSDKSCFTEDI